APVAERPHPGPPRKRTENGEGAEFPHQHVAELPGVGWGRYFQGTGRDGRSGLSSIKIEPVELRQLFRLCLLACGKCLRLLCSECVACLLDQSLSVGGNEVGTDPALSLELIEQIAGIVVLSADERLLDRFPGGLEIGNQHPVWPLDSTLDRDD